MARLAQALRRNADLALAFLAPIIVLAAVFVAFGVYPFGQRTIISGDCYHQYLPIMAQLQRAISEGGGLFYTFNAGLGVDFYSLSTYQNASPITWLFLALFPQNKLVLCATIMIMVKVGLISCAMYWYVKKLTTCAGGTAAAGGSTNLAGAAGANTSRTANAAAATNTLGVWVKLALAQFYALGGYVLAYCSHLMWLDALILLPIVVWGLRCVMDGPSGKLYVIALACLLFANYYLGLMVCLFVVFYFFVYYFGERKNGLGRMLARVAALSLLAGMAAAIVLVPTFFALQLTPSFATMGEGIPALLYHSIPTHIAQLLPASPLTMLEGPANLYSGLITLILFALFACNRSIDPRKRIAKTAFAVFLFVSTNIVPLDLFWHLFHDPHMFPGRFAFLLPFMLIEIAAESLASIKTVNRRGVLAALAFVVVLYLIAFAGGGVGANWSFVLFSGTVLLALYGFVLLIMRGEDGSVRQPFLAMVMAFEIVLVAFQALGASAIVQEDRYGAHGEEVAELLAIVEEEDPFARVELLGSDNSNAPLAYGYKGTSVFASSVPASTFQTLNALFNSGAPQVNAFVYSDPNPVSDALANIDYYISIGKEREDPWLKKVAQSGTCHLYESAYRTSVGYMLPESITQWNLDAPRADVLGSFVALASGEQGVVDDAGVDMDAWGKAYPQIFTDLLQVSEMRGNHLAGSISVHADGIFLTTIPASDGWQVRVDGTAIEDTNAVPYFVSFPLGAGEHTIEMTYVPKGFALGAAASMLALIIFLLLRVKNRLHK